ncbi:MAG: PAS domain S-box protein [bacterium]
MVNHNLLVSIILGLSITVQVIAAYLALRLIKVTGKKTAWNLIAIALVFMAVRRVVPFIHLVMGDESYSFDLLNESVGLILSICMASGISRIAPVFKERKRIENEFREKKEELDLYFNKALDLLCIADTDGFFRKLNPEWENTLGYSISELIDKPILEFVHPDDKEATRDVLSKLAVQKEVPGFVNKLLCKDGSYRWIEWRSFPSNSTIYAVARDITERKLAEIELQKQMDETERFNKIFVGREEKMIELKKEVNALLEKEGKPKKYNLP